MGLRGAFDRDVTQLLDQINHTLHEKYREERSIRYLTHQSINRQGFINVIMEIWPTWASAETIIKAAKRVGISETGLSVEWMQQKKFEQAARLISPATPVKTSTPIGKISSPADTRKGSKEYYKHKFEEAQKMLQEISDESINLEIAGVLKVNKIKPKPERKQVRLTQIYGSMEAKDAIGILKSIKESKQKEEERKEMRLREKEENTEKFLRCKSRCMCNQQKCQASGLKQCTYCGSVLKSVCSKAACRKDGKKPQMISVGPRFEAADISGVAPLDLSEMSETY